MIPNTFDRLVRGLTAAGLDPTRDELADALWLGAHIARVQAVQRRTGPADQPSPPPPRDEPQPPESPPPPPTGGEPPPGAEPRAELYARHAREREPGAASPEASTAAPGTGPGAGETRVPGVPALPHALLLGRALRPLRRRVASRIQRTLDAEATVERIAEQRLWVPVFRPRQERWLSLALVVDDHSSMRVWEPAIAELCRLLERHGAFAEVRLWRLSAGEVADPAAAELAPAVVLRDARGRACRPGELQDAAGRRAIWVLTDCIAPYWRHNDRLLDLLHRWAADNPLALVQMLPRRLWGLTILRTRPLVRLCAGRPGLRAAALAGPACPRGTLSLPILTLEPTALADWAGVTAGRPWAGTLGVALDALWTAAPAPAPAPADARARLAAFQGAASPQAQQLADIFCTIPLTLPIMRLAQQTLAPTTRLAHLAEVLLSGLIGRADRDLDPGRRASDPLQVPFDFLPGLREALLRDLPEPQVEAWARQLAQGVEQRLGQGHEFLALYRDPRGDPSAAAGGRIDDRAIPFVRMRIAVLRRLGGTYGEWAEALRGIVARWERRREDPATGAPDRAPMPDGPTPFRDAFKDGSGQGPAMVWLPGGTFTMGQDDSQWHDEKPAHPVRVGAFSIGQYPVTFDEYDRFCVATKRAMPGDAGWGRGNRPAINLSWDDARAYCDWLSRETGETYRLATEAEWEYACRAGSTTRWSCGDDESLLRDHAWYDKNAGGKTHPVGEKLANAWGLHDLHGNCWEWCQDWYSGSYYQQPASELQQRSPLATARSQSAAVDASSVQQPASENPSGPESGSGRVVRGGAWSDSADYCRSAFRRRFAPSDRYDRLGFRLSRTGPWHSYPITLVGAEKAPPPVQRIEPVGMDFFAPGRPRVFQPFEGFRDRFVILRKDGREEAVEAPELVYLPGGTFQMGDARGGSDERPVHPVSLSAFALGRTPVTWGDYRPFCEATGTHWPEWLEPGSQYHLETAKDSYYAQRGISRAALDLPVVGISWDDARAYCEWLSAATGERYALPTEAQWEYACRAGSRTRWCCGDDAAGLADYAWFRDNADGRLHPVGQKLANDWGLHDLHGNCWEWCADWYANDYYQQLNDALAAAASGGQQRASGLRRIASALGFGASGAAADASGKQAGASGAQQNASENPSGPGSGSARVIRGGAWLYTADDCRSAYRDGGAASVRHYVLGFRLSRTV